jgi:hypothetical protein
MGLGKTVQVAAFLSAVLGKSATSEDKRRTFPLPEGDCRQVLMPMMASLMASLLAARIASLLASLMASPRRAVGLPPLPIS